MANTTRTQIPAEVNNWYNRTLLERGVPYWAHNLFGQVRDIPQNAGTDTIKFRKYGSLSAATTPLTEGVTPAGSQLSVTDITAQVSQYGDFVTLTDKVSYETRDPILTETAEVLGEQSGNTLDLISRDVLNAGTSVQYASSATSRVTVAAGMVLDLSEIQEGVTTLKGNNARKITSMIDASTGYNTNPINACFVAINHTQTTNSIKNATGFKSAETYAQVKKLMPNEYGSLDEVRFLETTNAKVFTGAGAAGIDVYSTLILGKNAYGITRISGRSLQNIVKPLGSAGSADPLDQRLTSGWKATFVAKILQQDWILRIEHAIA